MSKLATISAVTLNQFALDFEGNYHRIVRSIQIAKEQGSRYRSGPELEICGYNCEDHFYESDTINHSWEVLAELLKNEICQDIMVDVGMPVMSNGVTYNCRVVFLNRKIILIRPKLILCDDGNYRETRWFTAWIGEGCRTYYLPDVIKNICGQESVLIGDALLRLSDTVIAFEICEELWNPNSSHLAQSLAGAEIILNGSGSHTEIRKAFYALELIKTASSKCGCVYVFSNLRGCDGERTYLNGCSTVVINGNVLKMGEQYSLVDVEVLTASIDLDEVRIYRNSIRSRNLQAAKTQEFPTVVVNWSLSLQPKSSTAKSSMLQPTPVMLSVKFNSPEEEIAKGPALWMWDYIRRSAASGFFLPLSGGVDSSSVAIIIYSMCHMIVNHIQNYSNSDNVLQDVRKVLKDENYIPENAKSLCNRILTTCYMGSENSSAETRKRASDLASAIGSNHMVIDISSVVASFLKETSKTFGNKEPSFSGCRAENLALQNVQARSRMVYAYLFAQLTPWANGNNGFLLVVGTSNVDEAIRGYFTKYDCSAADLNPIGGISKTDLKSFILYAATKFNLSEVAEIVEAPPTAELQPLADKQTDEQDMGMTYEELGIYGNLRKPLGCGPFSMVARLLHLWKDKHSPSEISRKVKHFYVSYACNRHKMSILTPACHMENYSPEDHRYDLRPLFYPVDFTWQFRKIDEMVSNAEATTSEVD